MNAKSANSSVFNKDSRCHHRYPNGSRCRSLTTSSSADFCPSHAKLPQNEPIDADLTPLLTCTLDDFKSATQINDYLSNILILLTKGRVTARRAAVLAYITNQLLRTLPAIDKELHADDSGSDNVPQIIIDMPRPIRTPAPPQAITIDQVGAQ